jgi:hypothetical protein
VKIAFWSNAYEQSAALSDLAAISVTAVMRYPYTVAVMENHLGRYNLGCAYLGNGRASLFKEVGTNYYEGGGIEGLLRRIYRGDKRPCILKPYLKEVISRHLYYIPQSGVIHNELFDYEFYYNSDTLFNLMEENFDISFIDTTPQYNLSSRTILEEADLIVVNLGQNRIYLEDFFTNYSSLIPKAIFIIGNYSTQSILSCRKLSRLYEIPA